MKCNMPEAATQGKKKNGCLQMWLPKKGGTIILDMLGNTLQRFYKKKRGCVFIFRTHELQRSSPHILGLRLVLDKSLKTKHGMNVPHPTKNTCLLV